MLPLRRVWHTFGDPAGWEDGPVLFEHRSTGMKQNSITSPCSDVRLASAAVVDNVWVVEAQKLSAAAACPRCQVVSSARHSSYQRRLWDLPGQSGKDHANGRPTAMSERGMRPVEQLFCGISCAARVCLTIRLPEWWDLTNGRQRRASTTARYMTLGHRLLEGAVVGAFQHASGRQPSASIRPCAAIGSSARATVR